MQHVAQTLQSCLELTDPVQQIQLIKKVCFRMICDYNQNLLPTDGSVMVYSLLLQAGTQLEALVEGEPDGVVLEACLHTLSLVFTSLQAKNPLRWAVARYIPQSDYFITGSLYQVFCLQLNEADAMHYKI